MSNYNSPKKTAGGVERNVNSAKKTAGGVERHVKF
jgi:hypothetical protein